MDVKTAICEGCGKAIPVWDLEGLNYGRGVKYFCPDCINGGRKQVDERVIDTLQKKKDKWQRGMKK